MCRKGSEPGTGGWSIRLLSYAVFAPLTGQPQPLFTLSTVVFHMKNLMILFYLPAQ